MTTPINESLMQKLKEAGYENCRIDNEVHKTDGTVELTIKFSNVVHDNGIHYRSEQLSDDEDDVLTDDDE